MDYRDENHTLCDGRSLRVNPDVFGDFRDMPFADKAFKLVVFDPPHFFRNGKNGWTHKKYGTLPVEWEPYLKAGFDECMRVLDDYGVLIFKWNELEIPVSKVIKTYGVNPLFGHKSGARAKTHWLCFMKTSE